MLKKKHWLSGGYLSASCSTLGDASRFMLGPPTPHPPLRNSYTVRFQVSMVEWQRKNEISIHRTVKHFSIEGGGVIARENVASHV